MKVNLTYFKETGKYYSEGSYETEKEHLFEIFNEVRQKVQDCDLPGLVKGCSEFIVGIDVPDHPHNHPRLIVPSKEKIREMKTYQVWLVLEETDDDAPQSQLETYRLSVSETEEKGRAEFEGAQHCRHNYENRLCGGC